MSNTYRHRRKRKKRFRIPRGYIYIAAGIIALAVLIVGIYAIKKYTPTKEHMDLADYFQVFHENEAAVVLDGEYISSELEEHGYAIVNDGNVYLELGFVKDYLDDGYVYDSSEITLRYATDSEVYTATVGSADYSIDKSNNSLGLPVVLAQDDTVYIAEDYLKLLTDFKINYYSEPDRVVVQTVGSSTDLYTAKRKTQIRKLNGPKSPVLEDVTKGEAIYVVRYGLHQK